LNLTNVIVALLVIFYAAKINYNLPIFFKEPIDRYKHFGQFTVQ